MDRSPPQPMATPDLVREAESLIRALRGVRHVKIETDDDGFRAVHVTSADPDTDGLAARIRSALLAGLATPIVPGRIHVRSDDDTDDDTPRDRLRLLHHDATEPDTDAEPAPRPAAPDEEEPRPSARPRLVTAEAERPGDGRVLCRVAVAYRTRVRRAEAVAVDLPGAAAQAAAQAAVRALIDAGLAGLELLGLREVEIAGTDYVLVALRRTEPFAMTRSGSAPITGSAERSAAQATVAAAVQMT